MQGPCGLFFQLSGCFVLRPKPIHQQPDPPREGDGGGLGRGGEEGFGCSQWWSLKPGATETSRWKQRKREWKKLLFFLLPRACVSCYTSADKRSYSILGSLAPSMGCRGHRNHKVPCDETLCLEWSGWVSELFAWLACCFEFRPCDIVLQSSLNFIFPQSSFSISPWYNHTGWLGVKHQVTYLLC